MKVCFEKEKKSSFQSYNTCRIASRSRAYCTPQCSIPVIGETLSVRSNLHEHESLNVDWLEVAVRSGVGLAELVSGML